MGEGEGEGRNVDSFLYLNSSFILQLKRVNVSFIPSPCHSNALRSISPFAVYDNSKKRRATEFNQSREEKKEYNANGLRAVWRSEAWNRNMG